MKLRGALVSLAAVAAVTALPSMAMAEVIYQNFGPLPDADWGGTGIPNDAVAKTVVWTSGGQSITLGLTAHARYYNPALTNDGAGTFFAQPGLNDGLTGGAKSTAATWNFGYYVKVDGVGADLGDYKFSLYYDFDPGQGTAFADLGSVNINNGLIGLGDNPSAMTKVQDSQNLYFSWLDLDIPGVVDTPTYASFNPYALGQYSFYLVASSLTGTPLATVGIDVTAVPLPAAAWLFGTALIGLGAARRMQRRSDEGGALVVA